MSIFLLSFSRNSRPCFFWFLLFQQNMTSKITSITLRYKTALIRAEAFKNCTTASTCLVPNLDRGERSEISQAFESIDMQSEMGS